MTTHNLADLSKQLTDGINAITPSPIWVTGTLSAWTRKRAWTRGELLAHKPNSTQLAARLQIGCTGRLGAGIEKRFGDSGTALQTGVVVQVYGTLAHHPIHGLRFEIRKLEATGELSTNAATRAQLEAAIIEEELDKLQQQLTWPTNIGTIGLIAPQTSDAAYQDAHNILSQHPAELIERRIPTAGPKAPAAISAAITFLQPKCHVIVAVRGGGAASELIIWDSEVVVHAIAHSRIPIVVGIGHSTDEVLADKVAHTTAATPTAAARWVCDPPKPTASIDPRPTRSQTTHTAQPPTRPSIRYTPPQSRPRRIRKRTYVAAIAILLVAVAYFVLLT